MRHVRQKPRTRSRINAVRRQVTNIVRSVIGRKWGDYVTLMVSKETKSITLQFRNLATSKINRLKVALSGFVVAQRNVSYCPQKQKVSLA